MLTRGHIMQAAANLLSDDGENLEYDRAIVELVSDTCGFSTDDREATEALLRNLPPQAEPSLTLYVSHGCEAEVEALDEVDEGHDEHTWIAVDQDGNDVPIRLAKGSDERQSSAF